LVIYLATLMMLGVLTGWLDRREREAVAYLIEENRLLRRQLGRRRLALTDDDRPRLAARAYRLGRAGLPPCGTRSCWYLPATAYGPRVRRRTGVRGPAPATRDSQHQGRDHACHLDRGQREGHGRQSDGEPLWPAREDAAVIWVDRASVRRTDQMGVA